MSSFGRRPPCRHARGHVLEQRQNLPVPRAATGNAATPNWDRSRWCLAGWSARFSPVRSAMRTPARSAVGSRQEFMHGDRQGCPAVVRWGRSIAARHASSGIGACRPAAGLPAPRAPSAGWSRLLVRAGRVDQAVVEAQFRVAALPPAAKKGPAKSGVARNRQSSAAGNRPLPGTRPPTVRNRGCVRTGWQLPPSPPRNPTGNGPRSSPMTDQLPLMRELRQAGTAFA